MQTQGNKKLAQELLAATGDAGCEILDIKFLVDHDVTNIMSSDAAQEAVLQEALSWLREPDVT